MDPLKASPHVVLALVAALACAPVSASASEWREYHARYSVYRNGQLAGKAEFAFERNGERWIVRSESSGTHGMARLLSARDLEYTEGRILDGRFRPDEFTHHTTVSDTDTQWVATFDWDRRRIEISEGWERRQLDFSADALDGLSLKLEMQRRLRDGEDDLDFHLVDSDEIKLHRFRQLAPERLETSLGCLDTVPVERVRTGSTRYTRAWHATGYDYIAVRIEHGKTGGDHLEMRIAELKLGGVPVAPQPGCVALQGDP